MSLGGSAAVVLHLMACPDTVIVNITALCPVLLEASKTKAFGVSALILKEFVAGHDGYHPRDRGANAEAVISVLFYQKFLQEIHMNLTSVARKLSALASAQGTALCWRGGQQLASLWSFLCRLQLGPSLHSPRESDYRVRW